MTHPYKELSLFTVGLVVAIALIGLHAAMLLWPKRVQSQLKAFPRSMGWGQVLLALAMTWFWLLIAPASWGRLGALGMDLNDFNGAKPILRLLIPILTVLLIQSVRDFLAVRALGILGLLVAMPMLEAAFLKDPSSRLWLVSYTYVMIFVSMFCIGMPYLFRDAVTWVTANAKRWTVAGSLGLL
jgi:hypothetical protein